MSQLSDVHQAQALPGVIASQAQVQNQNLVHGSAAAGQNVQHAKAAEEEVGYAEETQNPRVRAEGGRPQPGRRVLRHRRRRRRSPGEGEDAPPSPEGQGSIIDITA